AIDILFLFSAFSASESADIVLLIDSSDALGRRAFPSVKSFVNRIINSLPIGPNRYRIALVQYSDDVKVEFQLDDYKAKNPMLNQLKKVSFKGGPLRTGNAIRRVHETFFRSPRKDRSQIVVVTTSATSDDPVEEAASRLRRDGIKIIALGIQEAVPQALQSIATPPFHYKFGTPRDLLAFSQNMSEVIGKAAQMEIFTNSVADIVFIVDEGVSQANAEHIREFLQNTVNSLDVKEACIRMGIVTYSTEAKVLTSLGDETKKTDILQKIRSFSPKEGKSHLGAAINMTTKRVFADRRRSVEKVATIITHRPSDDDITGAASLISRAGVTVFAIGVERADTAQLTQVVSYPSEPNIIKLTEFSDLPRQDKTFHKKLFNKIKLRLYIQPEMKKQIKSGCMDTERADIYFLLDDSSSIHVEEFKNMTSFVMEAIKLFTIGPDNVRFGVVQYSENTILPIRLGQHTTRISLEKEMNRIRHRALLETNTGAAINFTRPLFKDARQQCRGNVPCYLIVLTDGKAHDDVKVAAQLLRQANVSIYAIGVKNASKEELFHIAGSTSRVYFVQQFEALEEIKNVVVRDICNEKACEVRKVDVMFLVDSSGSIHPEDFAKMQNFMAEFVKKSNIGPEQMCVGAVQFSGTTKEKFPLNRYLTKNDIIDAIGSMSLIGANTLTGEALVFISDYFEAAKGARPGAHKVLILITDGEAQDEVKTPATALRDKGITIYSVGVFNANKTQLEEISGKPERVFYVENFDVLNKVQNELRFGVCNPEEECKRLERLDIVFVIDSSGSIGPNNYNLMKNFMIGIVNKSDVGKELVQFGALKYSDDPHILFDLDDHSTQSAVIDAIRSDTHLGGNTYTAAALEHSKALFTEARGSRKHRGVSQILMVITDGESHDKERLEKVSKKLRDDKITILAIGIKEAKLDELLTMAGSEENLYFVDTFEGLQNISKKLSDNLCNNSRPECEIQADLVFLIDGSRSIPPKDFERMKVFLKNLLDLIDYNDNVRVGMAQFADRYEEEFGLGAYQNKPELQEKIISVTMMKGGNTYIGEALKGVKAFFNSTRRRIPRHIVVPKLLLITDGVSDDPVADSARALAADGVEIHAIGVGTVDRAKLMEITDDSDRIYSVANFTDLTSPCTVQCYGPGGESLCFMDVVIGFDISSQKAGDHIFHEQHLLETYLPDILKDFTSYGAVSCNKGTKTQFSVANLIENTDTPFLRTLQVDHEKILEDLRKVRLNGPSYLNVEFLDSLWNVFENVSGNHMRSQVLLVFSDGLDADKEVLKKKSEELRKKGLDGIITVALEGVTNFADLLDIEFGKGFGYNKQLSMGTQNIASRLFTQIAERTCCCKFCTCMPEEGPRGPKGKIGTQVWMLLHNLIYYNHLCMLTPFHMQYLSCRSVYQFPNLNIQGVHMQTFRASFRQNAYVVCFFNKLLSTLFCILGTLECPVYPTDLVFALDASQDTTPQIFEQMREMVIAVVNNTQIRESNCPVGARVAVVCYNSETHYLIRFSDFHNKQRLLEEIAKLSYQRSTNRRDTGTSMRFVARNVFKRTLPGANMRKVAVFFSNGPSDNGDSLSTAVLEFSAFDIHPAVIAFKTIPSIHRAFALGDTRLFQVIQPGRDYTLALQRLQSCVLCYDKCKPDSSCFRAETPRARGYVDAAFILENSRKISPVEFQKLKDFLSAALDSFDISAEPETSLTGDRVAVLSHAPLEFRPRTRRSPVEIEFDFLTYGSKLRMKRHIQESIQQLNGVAALGHAIQWTVSNIFSEAPNQRKYKAIFVVSVGETSRWDKEVLRDAALRAKCLGYALFVLSLGDEYDDVEIEELASLPLEHHVVQLGRIHKAELGYAVKFLKPFLRLLKSKESVVFTRESPNCFQMTRNQFRPAFILSVY
uniref:VWFA domain-containing protein n=1 Tax=Podarcis muralis TaxID=64176 RepID=A0A670KF57_PODMU